MKRVLTLSLVLLMSASVLCQDQDVLTDNVSGSTGEYNGIESDDRDLKQFYLMINEFYSLLDLEKVKAFEGQCPGILVLRLAKLRLEDALEFQEVPNGKIDWRFVQEKRDKLRAVVFADIKAGEVEQLQREIQQLQKKWMKQMQKKVDREVTTQH